METMGSGNGRNDHVPQRQAKRGAPVCASGVVRPPEWGWQRVPCSRLGEGSPVPRLLFLRGY